MKEHTQALKDVGQSLAEFHNNSDPKQLEELMTAYTGHPLALLIASFIKRVAKPSLQKGVFEATAQIHTSRFSVSLFEGYSLYYYADSLEEAQSMMVSGEEGANSTEAERLEWESECTLNVMSVNGEVIAFMDSELDFIVNNSLNIEFLKSRLDVVNIQDN
ncbi:hypothetical protein [Vibrio harveyi]|uniref:hypothetical protein n=1 Tax=Vibrio harveyi TaxID=669 RepID=UPI003D715760